MSKRIKILLAVIVAVVVLTVGSGVAVMAAGGQTTTQSSSNSNSNSLLAKVAAILGNVTEQQLTDAFKQAGEQTSKDVIETLLTKAVTNGTITAAEKTAIETWLAQRPDPTDKDATKTWLQNRPTVAKKGFLNSLIRAPGKIKAIMPGMTSDAVMNKVATILNISEDTLKSAFQQAAVALKNENVGKALDKAVANGKITQDEANQIQSWWAQRPAALDKLMPGIGPGMMWGIRGGMRNAQPKISGATAQ